jgi:cold shock CspA family protein
MSNIEVESKEDMVVVKNEDIEKKDELMIGDNKTEELVVANNDEEECGEYQGMCKWFDKRKGYGFIKVVSKGDKNGEDIFVHYSGIKSSVSSFQTLNVGEYISFNIITGENGFQASNVKGINGGPLMCDTHASSYRYQQNRYQQNKYYNQGRNYNGHYHGRNQNIKIYKGENKKQTYNIVDANN